MTDFNQLNNNQPRQSKKKQIFIWLTITAASLGLIALVMASQMDVSEQIKGFEKVTNNFFVQTLHTDTLMPPPLRGVFGQASTVTLTEEGVLAWTNKNREDAALKDLTANKTLSTMAQMKLRDLFGKQYFEHVSPSGVGPGELAKAAGYSYIVIGENLALGNFDGDKALVDAWMASPGHRANILNVRYREIGIAVGQGSFEGKTTWIAVQEFGLPITACPQPSASEKTLVDQMKKDVDSLEKSLTAQKAAIDAMVVKNGPDYNSKVEAYNNTVHKFNALVLDLKSKISDYNKDVATFNDCAELTKTPAVSAE